MNPNYSVQEMVYQMKNTEAKIILVHPSLVDNALAAAKQADISPDRLFQFSDTVNSNKNDVRDCNNGLLATTQESHSYQWPELTGGEGAKTIATINYSSGTTGLPKGACMYTIIVAAKMQVPVYVMKKFVYEDFLRVIQDHKITQLHVAPPIMVMLSKRPETAKYYPSSVKLITCGAAPLSRKLQNEVSEKLGVIVQQGSGMTEELIKVNALQVAPAELEAALLEHDGIADAAVVGMTLDDEEFPRAYVVPKENAKQTNSSTTPAQIQE
ncbi:hypothetical protein RJ035_008160 [Blastomyces gilchristii]